MIVEKELRLVENCLIGLSPIEITASRLEGGVADSYHEAGRQLAEETQDIFWIRKEVK